MQRIVTYRVSDISGVELRPMMSKMIRYSFDGIAYSIDLTNEEAIEFEQAIGPWIAASKRLGGKRPVRARRSGRSSRESIVPAVDRRDS